MARGRLRPLALAVAIGGLVAAGVGLLRPAARDLDRTPPGDAALVDDEPILMSDLVKDAETLENKPYADATPAERAHALHTMIDEELLVQRGLALDLPEQATEVRSAMADAVNALVTAPVLATPRTDDELQAYYSAHRDRYATGGTMAVTDLVLHVGGPTDADQTVAQGMADAAEAAYELRSGAQMADVEQRFGLMDSGRVSGTEQDFAVRLHLGPKLYAVAEALSDGEVSEPVADADGVHLLVMQHRQPPVFTGLEGVRNNVYADYLAAEEAKAEQANLASLRQTAKILLAPGQRE